MKQEEKNSFMKVLVKIGQYIAAAAVVAWRAVCRFCKENWEEILRPITVLCIICLAVSTVLSVTNGFTAPVIEQADRDRADAARSALLPADSFEAVEGEWPDVTEAYRGITDGGTCGYVITATTRGYGGDIPVLVAFDNEGAVLGVEITNTSETVSLGKKIEEPAFKEQFTGLAAAPLTLNEDVQQVAGATISSKAALRAVNAAIDAWHDITE